MIADCAFVTGSTHEVCQDYARYGKGPNGPYAIVADGCSSSPDSDIGARLIVLAAEKFVGAPLDLHAYHNKAIDLADAHARSIGLPQFCLDATLMTVKLEKGVPLVMVYGDGYVASRRNGVLQVLKISYPNNTPRYLSYRLDENRKGEILPAVVEEFIFRSNGWEKTLISQMDQDFFFKYMDPESDFVAVMTDGAGSFLRPVVSQTSKSNEAVPPEDVLPALLDFKTFQSGFVQRRVKRLIKDSREKQWQHYDDLAIGALATRGEKMPTTVREALEVEGRT